MKRSLFLASAVLCAASCGLYAQGPDSSSSDANPASANDAGSTAAAVQRPVVQNAPYGAPALSRVSFGGGFSLLGVGMQVSTNVNQHLNVRAVGNLFKYSTSFTTSNIPATADLNLASAGGLLDYYPFHAGFRLSGGVLFLNNNEVNATAQLNPGDSFTLNGQTYYSANPNPVTGATSLSGTGNLALNTTKPSMLLTTGWGNHVKHSGHLSFPFEIGAAFVGTPKTTVNLSGWACTDNTNTNCTNISDPNNPIAVQFQQDLSAQVAKWNKDIAALKVYPVISTGIAYSFNVRGSRLR